MWTLATSTLHILLSLYCSLWSYLPWLFSLITNWCTKWEFPPYSAPEFEFIFPWATWTTGFVFLHTDCQTCSNFQLKPCNTSCTAYCRRKEIWPHEFLVHQMENAETSENDAARALRPSDLFRLFADSRQLPQRSTEVLNSSAGTYYLTSRKCSHCRPPEA